MTAFSSLGVTFVSGLVIGFGISSVREMYRTRQLTGNFYENNNKGNNNKGNNYDKSNVMMTLKSYLPNMFAKDKVQEQSSSAFVSPSTTSIHSSVNSNNDTTNVQSYEHLEQTSSQASSANSDSTEVNTRFTHLMPYPIVLPPHVNDAETAQILFEQFAEKCLQIAQYGLPSRSEVRCYGAYLSGLNLERRIPSWVAELIDYRSTSTTSSSTNFFSSSSSTSSTTKKAKTTINNVPDHSGYDNNDHKTETKVKANNFTDNFTIDEEENFDSDSSSDGNDKISRHKSYFYADRTVPQQFRVYPNDYMVRKGFSRGHLAAAQLHKHSQEELNATFNMNANIIPQDRTMNSTDWERLEELSHNIGKQVAADNGRVFLVSGPLFAPRWVLKNIKRNVNGRKVEEIVEVPPFTPHARALVEYELTGKSGPVPKKHGLLRRFAPFINSSAENNETTSTATYENNNNNSNNNDSSNNTDSKKRNKIDNMPSVAIPTHLYKVIVTEQEIDNTSIKQNIHYNNNYNNKEQEDKLTNHKRKIYTSAAFIMPNGPIVEEEPLTHYQVPVEDVERLTGLEFFPTLRASRLSNMCKAFQCNAHTASIFKVYRQVAQLRMAESIPELNQTFARIKRDAEEKQRSLQPNNNHNNNNNNSKSNDVEENIISKAILKELERKREELTAMAVREVDDVEISEKE